VRPQAAPRHAPKGTALYRICNKAATNDASPRASADRRGLHRWVRRYGVPVTGRPQPRHDEIDLSEHAVEQYRARIRPGLDHDDACVELARLVPSGDIRDAPPQWAHSASAKPYYLVIGDALALPLAAQHGRWVTTTCLVQTTLTPRRREERTRRKAQRAAAGRAAAERAGSRHGHACRL
jgi:hypothetical protein